MVNVVVPDVPTVTGVAVNEYEPAAKPQVYWNPETVEAQYALFMYGGVAPVNEAISPG